MRQLWGPGARSRSEGMSQADEEMEAEDVAEARIEMLGLIVS